MTPSHPRHPGELVFTLLLIAGTLLVGREALRISGLSGPSSPGFGPLAMVAVVLLGLAYAAVRALLDRPAEREPIVVRLRRLGAAVLPPPVLGAVPVLVLYLIGLELVGFVLATFLFLLVSIVLLDRGRPIRAALVAAGTVGIIWLLFQQIFQVLLP